MCFGDATVDFGAVMTGWLTKKSRAIVHGSHLHIGCTKIETAKPGEGDGSGAHGARFQRHVDITSGQALIGLFRRCFADRQEFRVSGGIIQLEGAVAGSRQDRPSICCYHRADRHLAALKSLLGLIKRDTHGEW